MFNTLVSQVRQGQREGFFKLMLYWEFIERKAAQTCSAYNEYFIKTVVETETVTSEAK